MARRNVIPIAAAAMAVLLVVFFYSSSGRQTFGGLPQRLGQHVGLGEHVGNDAGGSASRPPGEYSSPPSDPNYTEWNPKANFKPGSQLPSGHNYTSVLVIARTKEENIDWMDEKLPDQVRHVYVADDPSAPLHPPKNKGHEVMIYLTWIIDNYDKLPDVAIFMHAHQLTWHNDELLGYDAANMISRLSRQRVWREGFVNMRCTWYPGCPDWMHPGETEQNGFKPEEILLAKSWSEIFPLDEVPAVLAQPCCAQFALSRERIQAKPHAQYIWYRNWMFNTQLPDHLSGRIWEYVWQFVFTGDNIYCPKEHVCFCDQYGMCFGGEDAYNTYLSLKGELGDRERDLREWEEKAKAIEEAKEKGETDMLAKLEKPEPGKDAAAKKEIERLRPIVDGLRDDAEKRGQDPRNRALEAGREWHEGDDF